MSKMPSWMLNMLAIHKAMSIDPSSTSPDEDSPERERQSISAPNGV